MQALKPKKKNLVKMKNALLKKFRTKSRVMSPKGDINVILQGTKCFADYKTGRIVLPVGDFTDPDYLQMLEGAIDHEIGHWKHSSLEAVIKASNISQRVNWLRNAIEDVRMERLVVSEFPGARSTLLGLVDQAMKMEWFKKVSEDDTAIQKFTGFILYYLRYTYMLQTQLKPLVDIAEFHLKASAGIQLVEQLKAILDKLPELVSPMDSVDLAVEVEALLEPEEQDDSNDNSDDDSNDNSDDDSNDNSDDDSNDNSNDDSNDNSNDDSNDNSDDDSNDNSNDDSNDNSDDDSNDNSDDDSNDNSKEELEKIMQFYKEIMDSSPDELPEDLHKMIEQALEESSEEALDSGAISESDLNQMTPSRFIRYGEIDFSIANKASSKIKSTLHRVLYDMNRSNVSHSKRGLGVDSNRLAGVSAGNFNVFRQEQVTKAPNTAITLLIDRSGSMNFDGITIGGISYGQGFKMKVANEAAFALSKGIDALPGASCEVLYYPFSRHTELHVAKRFNEKSTSTQQYFKMTADEGTPTGQAMQVALQRLAIRPEPRKMLFVITDGDPSYDQIDLVEQSLTEADLLKIDVVAFGVCTSNVKGFEESGFVHVDDVSQLNVAIKDAIKQKLLK